MIELVGVTKQYLYGARVLGTVDMTIKDGEIIALLGEEQSGKTTFIKVVGGVTDCEGEIYVDGKKTTCKTDDVIIVFDDLAMFENRTVYQNMAYPLKIRGLDDFEIDKKVKECAERVGIVACLYDKVKKLPLIDQKRVALSRIFLRDPKLILVDELTRGLSYDDARTLWSEAIPMLLERAKEGISVVFSTKDKDEAISIADRIAVFHYGSIKQVGTYDEILSNPSNIWAIQALDCDYHFENATLERRDSKLVGTLDDGYTVDLSHLDGKIADGYEGRKVYLGWKSSDFDIGGNRKQAVAYSLRTADGYILVTDNGFRIHSPNDLLEVGTLPNAFGALPFDAMGENSIVKSCK